MTQVRMSLSCRSSSFKRLTSSAFIPPYYAHQRWNAFSETSSA